MKSGPIIIIEDDNDDQEILEQILRELGVTNKLIWFTNAADAFTYFKVMTEQPFIILSDVNLPGENGIDLKWRIDTDPELRKKSIPFVFYSTSVAQKAVTVAYTKMTVQGFFQKSSGYDDAKNTIKLIIDYWKVCKHPHSQ